MSLNIDRGKSGKHPPFQQLNFSTDGNNRGGGEAEENTASSEALVLNQYKSSPIAMAAVGAVISVLNDLNKVILEDFIKMLDVNQAVGWWLDVIGDYVGVKRSGRDDNSYRQVILFIISLNETSGTPDDLIAFTSIYLDGYTDIDYSEPWYGHVHIHIVTDKIIPDDYLEKLDKIAMGGIKVSASTSKPINKIFGFETEPLQFPDPKIDGFGELSDPSIGGVWSELIT